MEMHLVWATGRILLESIPPFLLKPYSGPIILYITSSSVYKKARFLCRQGRIDHERFAVMVQLFNDSLVRELFKAEPNWITTKPVMEADWNVCLQTLEGYSDSVYSVAFLGDGYRLASALYNHTVKIWDPAIGNCL